MCVGGRLEIKGSGGDGGGFLIAIRGQHAVAFWQGRVGSPDEKIRADEDGEFAHHALETGGFRLEHEAVGVAVAEGVVAVEVADVLPNLHPVTFTKYFLMLAALILILKKQKC